MLDLLKVLTTVYSLSLLPYLISSIMLIVAYFSKCKLMRVVTVVYVCHLILCVLSGYFPRFFWHQPEVLLIINAYNIDSSTAPFFEILTKSYIPNGSIAYRDEEDRRSICLSKNGYFGFGNEYDPRLLPALWFSYLSRMLRQESFESVDELRIPFSWDSLLDLQTRLYLQHKPFRNLDCSKFYDFHGLNGTEFLESCQDLPNREGIGGIQFKIFQPLEASMSEEVRKIIGSSYLMHSAPPPEKLFLLGVGPNKVDL